VGRAGQTIPSGLLGELLTTFALGVYRGITVGSSHWSELRSHSADVRKVSVRKFGERIFPRYRPRVEKMNARGTSKTTSNRRRGSKLFSTSAVYAALIGDVFVAVSKVGAAIWTGSAAMMSEAIHSIVDTTKRNLICSTESIAPGGKPTEITHLVMEGNCIFGASWCRS
jgi:hypothetical protein